MWQHRSSPLRVARPGPHGSTGAHLGREARSGAKDHVAAPKLSSQGGRAWSHGTYGSVRAHLGREARSGAEEYVAAPELNSVRRQDPGLQSTWQHQSSPQQGGEVRDHGTCGGSRAHLIREVWSEATACVAACGCTPCSLSSLRACMRGYPFFRVPTSTMLTGKGSTSSFVLLPSPQRQSAIIQRQLYQLMEIVTFISRARVGVMPFAILLFSRLVTLGMTWPSVSVGAHKTLILCTNMLSKCMK
jgi:hypothetical protein